MKPVLVIRPVFLLKKYFPKVSSPKARFSVYTTFMTREEICAALEAGNVVLGIELGSTRIKAIALAASTGTVIATGSFDWENRLENGIWTYHLEEVEQGLQACYSSLIANIHSQYGCRVRRFAAIGISAMMHGYLAFNKEGQLLSPFRTWRNTCTQEAATILSKEFNFNVPQRWSIAHLYQLMLDKAQHLQQLDFLTTLAGYVHWRLTGKRVLGIGDASGMFPVDGATGTYDASMMATFNGFVEKSGFTWKLDTVLPQVLKAGDGAGRLTDCGAGWLDPTGMLESGIPLCPPEGDADTGMVATNAVAVGKGNVSAGTSIFAMIVMQASLKKAYPEIDVITTPEGRPVAMVHGNNCTGDIDGWVRVFHELSQSLGLQLPLSKLYDVFYQQALVGEPHCGGLMSYNFLSGEHLVKLDSGRPLLMRLHDSNFTLGNLARSLLYSSMATLKIGLEVLVQEEGVELQEMVGHGGLFKTPEASQRMMAAMGFPVSVLETAGEGGAWGIAVLADYMLQCKTYGSLGEFLQEKYFSSMALSTVKPNAEDVAGFATYMESFKSGLAVEAQAGKWQGA